jgi:hypothetical protein
MIKMSLTIRDSTHPNYTTSVLLAAFKDRPISDLFPIIQEFLSRVRDIPSRGTISVTSGRDGYAQATDILQEWLEGDDEILWVDIVTENIKISVGEDQIVWFLSREEAESMNYDEIRAFVQLKMLNITGVIIPFALDCDSRNFHTAERRQNFNHKFTNRIQIYMPSGYDQTRQSINVRCPRLLPQDPTCVICQEVLMTQNCSDVRRADKCGHLFHAACIEELLAGHNTCPLCRAVV